MASTFARLRKPLATLAVITTTTAGGALLYTTLTRKPIPDSPLVALQRDANGRVIPPEFPSLKSRAHQLAELRRHDSDEDAYDLLVIGGGATGTGIALDAATRGFKVALVERDDFSSGTSSKSTKLVHGGVRYLEKAVMNLDYPQLQLVMEALRERKTFLEVAPHLSSSLPILLPLHHWWQAPYFWAGTKAYDLLAGSQGLESSYYLTRRKALDAFPLLKKENLKGALVYYDGQHNDSRMNVSLALTAAIYGVSVVNHAEVTALEKDASGKIRGARVRDVMASREEDGHASTSFSVRAKGVINATGPFADAIEKMDDPSRMSMVAPSAGVHIMLPSHMSPEGMGILDAATSDGRVVFVLPWQGATLAGTTDAPCEVEREPVATETEIDFILKEVRKLLAPETTLSRSDILAAWSGIRPLVKDPKAKNTESLVRNHLITVSDSGLLTCAGGKWTTYRQMAEDAVDEAIEAFHLQPKAVPMPDISGAPSNENNDNAWIANGKCVTRHVPLVGAHGFSRQLHVALMERYDLDPDVAQHLASNYGDRAWEVAAAEFGASETETAARPASRIVPGLPFIDGEIRHGIHREFAQTATDIMARRTRLAFIDVNAALRALPRVIDVMAEELQWSETRKQREWTESVHFLKSMGLSPDKLGVTREEVVNSQLPAAASPASGHERLRPSGGGLPDLGGLGGLGGLGVGGVLARDATDLSTKSSTSGVVKFPIER
ncbi:glycerol-3-phosphate dehydrogenase [Sodiomyces alkalinus F11]|uniref:Glycerol-3-phosphate dehydrogenase n=1 Tax=Sodiomyces alkalinus (strain CBS 110278 / VKM F-3762 / F11) TaxID=1314773 RepID=A0A3N2PL61_SODAK|nr:glycerol-3-phosphate dehydrogenase [Sodiomyces alkalinus F11]ROT35229.1 glycerol-3-phosphate dehydrogenase [Sodiomyces alkalinus F11]